MKYVIVFPSMNAMPGQPTGEWTMHYVEHRVNPFGMASDHKLSNATVFDKFEDARDVEHVLNEHSSRDTLLTTIMKVR